MPTTPTYPGVYIQELPSAVHPITGVATSIGAFVGYTARGIDNRAQQIFSFSDYERLYGGLASNSELSYAVQQFFANGGTQAWVVRTPATAEGTTQANVVLLLQLSGGASGGLTFTALSSGAWANGEILLDVDYNGLYQPVVGTVEVSATPPHTTVTGTGTFFKTALEVNQWLVFADDTTQTPYRIKSISGNTNLTLTAGYGGTSGVSTTAIVSNDPLAFNLTITNLVDGRVEAFPNVSLNSNQNNYVVNVVNDYDSGSQLVNVPPGGAPATNPTNPPAVTGLVGTPLTIANVNAALGGSNTPFAVTLTANSTTVGGTGFTASTLVGKWIYFGSDLTKTLYQVVAVASNGDSLTLATRVPASLAGATNATISNITTADNTPTHKGYAVELSVSSPSSVPSPFPITITVFPIKSPIPQTVSGLAAQLQRTINAALAIQMPGASVQCSVFGVGLNQAIRVNASLPQIPDAVIAFKSFTASPGGPVDISGTLGLHPVGTASVPQYSQGNANVAHYALGTGNGTSNTWGGQLTSSGLGADGSQGGSPSLPGTADIIGDPGSYTGLYALQAGNVDAFNLLCIPDATRAVPGNPAVLDSTVDPNAIYSAAIAVCDSKRAFLLLDCPPFVNTVSAAVDWKTTGLTVSDPNGAAFFPRLRVPDPLNNYNLRTFAPCGVVAGVYARTDSARGVWKAPAGTEATLSGVQSLVYKMIDAENGVLNPLGLNCFRTFPVYGSVLWGARTLVGADAETNQWKYVPVRRVALFLEASLYQGTQWVVFEPNDEPLWSAIRLNVGSFMQNLFTQGYFQGQTPAEAYFVKCDSETTTQTDIDNGIVNIIVGFAPLQPAEFVIIQIQQMAGQTAS